MDNLLRAVEVNWAALLVAGVVVALVGALLPYILRGVPYLLRGLWFIVRWMPVALLYVLSVVLALALAFILFLLIAIPTILFFWLPRDSKWRFELLPTVPTLFWLTRRYVYETLRSGGFLYRLVAGLAIGLWHRLSSTFTGEPLAALPPETEAQMRLAVRAELEAERKKSFWPNLWLNLFTNFLTNLIFFILGVVVTLLLSQPH